MESYNFTADSFSNASSSQRENLDAIFTSEKLDKLEELFGAINNLKINESGYELNTEAVSEAQGNLTSNPDTVTHSSNGILDQQLLICLTIVEVSALPLPINLVVILTPQTLLMPAVK